MNQKVWIGIAIGAGIGVAYAVSARNKRNHWDRWDPKEMRKKFADHGSDLLDRGKDMMDHLRVIYEEGQKVCEEAGELWNHGRRLVRS